MSALREAQPAPTCSEHALISAVRHGDDRAFEELYARFRPRIGSYILGMVGDHQRAEDIAQDVFIAALRRLRATERPIAFKPWIYEIAKNACIDEFRRAQRTREVSLDTEAETTPPARLIAHGADHAVEHKQRLDDLRGAFSGLSESHHRIIVMRELEGRSYSQIGESLGMSKPVVESTLFRARRKLSEEYEELVTGRRCERVQTVLTADGERPLRRLGIKERRLLARHLAHCQPCRRHARMAGVDESFFKTPSIAAKIAALLPLPSLSWLRRGHGGGGSAAAPAGKPSVAAVHSLQNAATYVDPSGPAASLSRAAAAAAAIVVAGAGGGLVTGLSHNNRMPTPRAVHSAPARAAGHAAAAPASSRAANTPAIPPAVPGATASSATSASTHRTRRRSERVVGSSSGGGSTQSSGSHTATLGSGSSGSGAASHSTTSSGAGTATSGAGSAVHNPLAAAAGTASKLLSGGGSGSSGSGSSGSGIQLPKVGPVQLPKIPISLPGLPSGSSSTNSSSSSPTSALPSVPLPTVPGLPDPNKLLSGLTGHS